MQLSVSIDLKHHTCTFREVTALAAGTVYNPLVVEIDDPNVSAETLVMTVLRPGDSEEILAVSGKFEKVSGHRKLYKSTLNLSVDGVVRWYEEETAKFPNTTLDCIVEVSDATSNYCKSYVPIILRRLSGEVVKGIDGISPEVEITKEGRALTIAVSDISGTHCGVVYDGIDGADGATPKVTTEEIDGVTNIVIQPSPAEITTKVPLSMSYKGVNDKPSINGKTVLEGDNSAAYLGLETVAHALTVQKSIDDEANRALAAEIDLSNRIDAETNRAETAESSLSGSITAETNRATGAESMLEGAISSETNRAISIENEIKSSVESEVTRATASEASLSDSIQSEASSRAAGDANTLESSKAYTDELHSQQGSVISKLDSNLRALNTAQGNIVDDLGTYVGDFNHHASDYSNPHKVTADQVGAYTRAEVDAKVSSVYRYRGSVESYDLLPTADLVVGDVYNVSDTGANYAWAGEAWDKLSETVDLTPYALKTELTAHTGSKANPHGVTAAQVGAYTKTEADSKIDEHASRQDNPHNVTVVQLGVYTSTETDDKIREHASDLNNPHGVTASQLPDLCYGIKGCIGLQLGAEGLLESAYSLKLPSYGSLVTDFLNCYLGGYFGSVSVMGNEQLGDNALLNVSGKTHIDGPITTGGWKIKSEYLPVYQDMSMIDPSAGIPFYNLTEIKISGGNITDADGKSFAAFNTETGDFIAGDVSIMFGPTNGAGVTLMEKDTLVKSSDTVKQHNYSISVNDPSVPYLIDRSVNIVDTTDVDSWIPNFPPFTYGVIDFIIILTCGCAPTFPDNLTFVTDASLESFSEWTFEEGHRYMMTFTQIGPTEYFCSKRELH